MLLNIAIVWYEQYNKESRLNTGIHDYMKDYGLYDYMKGYGIYDYMKDYRIYDYNYEDYGI